MPVAIVRRPCRRRLPCRSPCHAHAAHAHAAACHAAHAGPHVDPLELDEQGVVRAAGDPVERRRGGADLAEELALGDPRQPLAGPLQALGADVDQRRRAPGRSPRRRPCWARARAAAAGRPGRRSSPWDRCRDDEPADLDVVERQLGLAEVGADRGDEVGEDAGDRPSRPRAAGVALALIPEHALDLAAGKLAPGGASSRRGCCPLRPSWTGSTAPCSCRRGRRQTRPIGTRVCSTIATANGRPRPAPLVRVLCCSADRSARVLGSPEWTGSGESTSQCSGSSARAHLPSIPRLMTCGCGGVTSIRSPTPSMFDCPASTQRSPTKTGPTTRSVIVWSALLDGQADRVRTADRHADELAVDELDSPSEARDAAEPSARGARPRRRGPWRPSRLRRARSGSWPGRWRRAGRPAWRAAT